ncbi:MAG: hypothetical protein WC389_16840 [Lutibacter sp.]|jgi:hypothetical protein
MQIKPIDKNKIVITLDNGNEFIFHETDSGLKVQTLSELLIINRKGNEHYSATLNTVRKCLNETHKENIE